MRKIKCLLVGGLVGMMVISPSFTGYAKERPEDFQAVFDAEYYYNNNPDLQSSIGMDPEKLLKHFTEYGIREGRSGIEEFCLKAYIFNNPDLFLLYKTDLAAYVEHYVAVGKTEGRIAQRQESQGDVLGVWTTKYDETLPRAINLKLATERINGKIINPGEVISFSDTILSRTTANGYVSAPAIRRYEIGGGICQVSSTLYAAMCQALIPAVERHPHSQPISYLPEGLDATISEGYKDLKIQNPYSKPIQIIASAENGELTTRIQYYTENSNPIGWMETDGQWQYYNEDGTYKQDGWYWIDGDRDGTAECYYFNSDGKMASDTSTEDGYQVDINGAWIIEGVVQTKSAEEV